MLLLVLFRLGNSLKSFDIICELNVQVQANDAVAVISANDLALELTATSAPTEIGCR